MPLSLAKRRFARRLLGYAVNPARRAVRVRLGREQRHTIAGLPVVLPPGHDLPFYQRRDPTYDLYAVDVLRAVAAGHGRVLVVDVGANVGDTTLTALAADPAIRVRAVEGDPGFAAYLRRNVARFGDRVEVVERFVGPVGAARSFVRDGSTGGFRGGPAGAAGVEPHWVRPADLLADAADHDLVVWKSDIDGFDIHVLAEHWAVLDAACAVVWFEFDPVGTLGDRGDVARLVELIGDSGRGITVHDNLGRRMLAVAPGPAVSEVLAGLAAWLGQVRSGHLTVPYLDVWAWRPGVG